MIYYVVLVDVYRNEIAGDEVELWKRREENSASVLLLFWSNCKFGES